MNLLNADKLIEWIEANYLADSIDGQRVISKKEITDFISTNSIDIEYNATLNTSSVERTCDNCNNNNNGYCPIAHTCGTIKDEPDKWTPKADKVEGEKTND